jgi:hypothetical protein
MSVRRLARSAVAPLAISFSASTSSILGTAIDANNNVWVVNSGTPA